MNFEPVILFNNYIDDKYSLRLVSKDWLEIIKYAIFTYKIKYGFHKYINYLKSIYINIQIHCKPPQNITDVSMLGNLYTLHMSLCYNITVVSMLGNLHTLNMNHTNIIDVSMLGNLHTLYMKGCKNITDISMLGNLHTLYICGCKNITKYPEPNNIVNYYKN